MKLKALIFDVDGTLADTEEAHRCAFNEAFREHALDWSWSRPRYAHLLRTAGGKERIGAYIDSLPLDPAQRRTLRARIASIHASKTRLFNDIIRTGRMPLRDGVERLMDEAAAAGIELAIASTTTLANIETLLHTTLGSQSMSRFAAIGAGDQVAHKKPAPDIYRYVLRTLCRGAQECAAVEDSRNGLLAAKAAGLYTVVTPSYWTRDEDFSAADLVLPSLGSPARPLPRRAAVLVGRDVLGVHEIDGQIGIKEYQWRATGER